MKCAYCRQKIRIDPYQGAEGRSYDIRWGGSFATVHVHDSCLPRLVGDYMTYKHVLEPTWKAYRQGVTEASGLKEESPHIMTPMNDAQYAEQVKEALKKANAGEF